MAAHEAEGQNARDHHSKANDGRGQTQQRGEPHGITQEQLTTSDEQGTAHDDHKRWQQHFRSAVTVT